MTEFEWITVLLSVLAVLVLPTLALLVRMTVRWTRTEDQLQALISDVTELVESKDRVHSAMYKTMREDRAAADRRLRWLEENLWNRGTGRR